MSLLRAPNHPVSSFSEVRGLERQHLLAVIAIWTAITTTVLIAAALIVLAVHS